MSLNKAMILGNLGADPELRYTQSGAAVCTIRVATTESWREGSEVREKTEWHMVVLWKKLAENAAIYLQKGSKVFIEGRMTTRSYEDDKGQKRYIHEIQGQRIEFLSVKSGSSKDPLPVDAGEEHHMDIPF